MNMAITRPANRKQVDEFAEAVAQRPRAAVKLRGRKRPLALTLPPDLVEAVDAIATEEERSRAKIIEFALRQFVRNYKHREAA
jgi:hypothetical protein